MGGLKAHNISGCDSFISKLTVAADIRHETSVDIWNLYRRFGRGCVSRMYDFWRLREESKQRPQSSLSLRGRWTLHLRNKFSEPALRMKKSVFSRVLVGALVLRTSIAEASLEGM